jgi:dihydroneopterin aldolase/2-amino-4-hydroxy-6-hydroxymethyldihydropteridine diphosphokinase/dihydropteroate synthase
METPQDSIRVKDRLLNIYLASGSRWPAKGDRGTLQPISLSIDISYDVAPSSTTDCLGLSLNYSSISKKLGTALTESDDATYQSIEDVVDRALTVVQGMLSDVAATEILIQIKQLKAPLHCKDVGLEAWSVRTKGTWTISKIRHFVTDFTCPTIVGINDVERAEEQDVVVNISVETSYVRLDHAKLDFRQLTRSLWKVCAIFIT